MKTNTKRPYRAIPVNSVRLAALLEAAQGQKIVVAIDVAKERMVAALMDETERVLATVKWAHPKETHEFLELLTALRDTKTTEVAMEPTGSYGDALRHRILEADIPVFHVNPKHVHDAKELYDGVPSAHDAKACGIIGMLHLKDRSRRFVPLDPERRALKALVATLYRYERQHLRERRQLAALLARFWPGITDFIDVGRRSLLTLLETFGAPHRIADSLESAREILTQASKNTLRPQRIEALLDHAQAAEGERPCDAELETLKLLAADTLTSREKVARAKRAVEKASAQNGATQPLIPVVGKATAAALVAELGDLRAYESPASLVRAFGLNLKEASSGQYKGRLRITKRGSPRARHYLFFAALRLIYRDPVIRAWYDQKRKRSVDAGLLGVIAVMRKLAKALWHVARGHSFDARKLYDVRRLHLAEPVQAPPPTPFHPVDDELHAGI